MKRLALIAVMLVAGCEKTPSKLEGTVKGATGAGAEAADTAEVESALRGIEDRLTALEEAHKTPATGAQGDAALQERLQRVEASLSRREEALEFLEMAYAQQKRQQEAKEASEPDPDAVFAVDISAPLQAGQVEGPANALITIVEAWDFA